jgi:hypothetical protein
MRQAPWILAALLGLPSIGACDRDRESTAATPTSVTAPQPAAASEPNTPAPETTPPRPPALAVGDRLAPVTSVAADGTSACGACRLGQVPRLLVIGSADGLARAEVWRDLDAMSRLYGDNGLAALAIVVAEGMTPPKDPTASAAQIEAVRKKGRIAMPVEIAADTAALVGVDTDPSVVLVDGGDVVRYVSGVGHDWRDLDRAIGSLLAPK